MVARRLSGRPRDRGQSDLDLFLRQELAGMRRRPAVPPDVSRRVVIQDPCVPPGRRRNAGERSGMWRPTRRRAFCGRPDSVCTGAHLSRGTGSAGRGETTGGIPAARGVRSPRLRRVIPQTGHETVEVPREGPGGEPDGCLNAGSFMLGFKGCAITEVNELREARCRMRVAAAFAPMTNRAMHVEEAGQIPAARVRPDAQCGRRLRPSGGPSS